MTKVPKKAPIGLRQAENPLIKNLGFPIIWSVCCVCFFLFDRLIDLLMHIPIISHLLVAFLWILFCAIILVLLLVGVGAVSTLYSIVAEKFISSEKRNLEREMAEKTAELLNKNTELRAFINIANREKWKNHIETAKIFREGLANKAHGLGQRTVELQANLLKVIEEKGRNHPKTAGVFRELGENLKQLGNYQEAEEAHRAELEIFQDTLGAKSPDVARASRSIAELIFNRERSQEKSALLWDAEQIEKGYR